MFTVRVTAGAALPDRSLTAYVSVYVPTTPNPTGGYFVILPKTDCVELKMSVDEALKYVISMGVVVPGGASNPKLLNRQRGTTGVA